LEVTTLILLAAAGAGNPLPAEIAFDFRKGLERQRILKLVGPTTGKVVRTDPGGLRITLPAGTTERGPVGVEARFRLRGDFEVTLAYELLAVDNPPDGGAGVSLRLRFDNDNPIGASVTRLRKSEAGGQTKDTFGANLITADASGKETYSTRVLPAGQKRGQLRLVRAGETLRFFASETAGDFREIHATAVGTSDVKLLLAECRNGGGSGGVDVRLVRLSVRAEEMPNQPSRPTPPRAAG
jgi:Protein of unknown function (DUF1583) C domain